MEKNTVNALRNQIKNYGFDPKTIQIKPGEYRFGSSLPLKVLNPEGQWEKYLPKYEAQADKYETWGCTVWGSQNQIETLIKFLYSEEHNYNERYNYNLAEITEGGTDPQVVYESIRKYGLIDEKVLPFPDTYKDFCTPRPVTEDLRRVGEEWLTKYTFRHEWITPSNPKKMQEAIVGALKYSPIALSVTAWDSNTINGLYIDGGYINNHWCLCYGYREIPEGIVLKIFDSYDHSKKELHPTHNISFAKRIYLSKTEVIPTKSLWTRFIEWLFRERMLLREIRRNLN